MQTEMAQPTLEELGQNTEEYPRREGAMGLYRLYWISYIGMWGPRAPRDRRQHHWRLHLLLDAMEEVQEDIDREPGPLWDEFSKTLPGLREYWGNQAAWRLHHRE
jgi:hypothetical protein